jgi:hypothetical protein
MTCEKLPLSQEQIKECEAQLQKNFQLMRNAFLSPPLQRIIKMKLTTEQIEACERQLEESFQLMRNSFFIKQGIKRILEYFTQNNINHTSAWLCRNREYVVKAIFSSGFITYHLTHEDDRYHIRYSLDGYTSRHSCSNVPAIINSFFI